MDVCQNTIVFSKASSVGVVAHLLCMTGRRRTRVGPEHEKNMPPRVRKQMTGSDGIGLNRIVVI